MVRGLVPELGRSLWSEVPVPHLHCICLRPLQTLHRLLCQKKTSRSAAWPLFTLIPRREQGLGSRPPPTLTEIATVTREKPGRLSWGVTATQKLSSSALAFEGPAEAGSSPSVGWGGLGWAAQGWKFTQRWGGVQPRTLAVADRF